MVISTESTEDVVEWGYLLQFWSLHLIVPGYTSLIHLGTSQSCHTYIKT